jgi:RHS repeat-associated protein
VGRLLSQQFRGAGVGLSEVERTFGYDERGFLSDIHDSLRGRIALHHNARGDLTGVVRSHGTSDAHVYDGARNRVYSGWTAHGAALSEALSRAEQAVREGIGFGDPIDLYLSVIPHDEARYVSTVGNRLERVDRSDGTTLLYGYDACGQVVSKTHRSGNAEVVWRYAWNGRGELVRFTTPNGKEWTYRYDAMGRRVEKRSPTGDAWTYVWAGAVLLHTLKNGHLAETYVHEPGGGPLARVDEAVHYIVPDQIGAPSEELGPGGALEWAAQKGTWGEGFSRVGATGGEPFLGQWQDGESGLCYNLFRYYDPELGRYLSPDPIDLLGGLNLYVGVTDPFGEVDRWGLCPAKVPEPGQPPQTVRLFRGVTTGHPGLADAHEGTAYPIGGHSDPKEHNDGDTRSVFTSWTTDWGTARFRATKNGQGGVVLRA